MGRWWLQLVLFWFNPPFTNLKKQKKKQRQNWTPSDKTFWIRACAVLQISYLQENKASLFHLLSNPVDKFRLYQRAEQKLYFNPCNCEILSLWKGYRKKFQIHLICITKYMYMYSRSVFRGKICPPNCKLSRQAWLLLFIVSKWYRLLKIVISKLVTGEISIF